MPVQINMEMPRSCLDCRFCIEETSGGANCAAFGIWGREICESVESIPCVIRKKWCPLMEIEDQTWHIVADGELPQKEDQYLVTISANGFVEVLKGFWKHGRMDFINEDGCYFEDLNLVATAWMKWPEPWEGTEE